MYMCSAAYDTKVANVRWVTGETLIRSGQVKSTSAATIVDIVCSTKHFFPEECWNLTLKR